MNFHAKLGGASGIAPGHAVMARDGAWRVVKRPQNWITHVFREIELRNETRQIVAVDKLGIDAEMFVYLGPPARGAHG